MRWIMEERFGIGLSPWRGRLCVRNSLAHRHASLVPATHKESQTVNGLVLGFLLVLVSIGLSLIFGLLGIVNVAHGAFFALGAYFGLTLQC